MNWLWDLLGNYPWLALVLLGVVGQLFTPNPQKRQQARERERKRRMQMPTGADKPKTDADEVAERIRDLFMGKPSEVGTPQWEEELPQALPVSPSIPVPESAPRNIPRKRITRIMSAHDVKASHAYDVNVSHAYDIKVEAGPVFTLDAKAAIRAMIVLGPPRALASYDEDPLLSLHQRRV